MTVVVTYRGGSSPKILGWRRHCPISPFITESIYPFSETEKYELHIGLHLNGPTYVWNSILNNEMKIGVKVEILAF